MELRVTEWAGRRTECLHVSDAVYRLFTLAAHYGLPILNAFRAAREQGVVYPDSVMLACP